MSQKQYQVVVKDFDGDIIFARTWGVIGENVSDFDAEALDVLGILLKREARGLRAKRQSAA